MLVIFVNIVYKQIIVLFSPSVPFTKAVSMHFRLIIASLLPSGEKPVLNLEDDDSYNLSVPLFLDADMDGDKIVTTIQNIIADAARPDKIGGNPTDVFIYVEGSEPQLIRSDDDDLPMVLEFLREGDLALCS